MKLAKRLHDSIGCSPFQIPPPPPPQDPFLPSPGSSCLSSLSALLISCSASAVVVSSSHHLPQGHAFPSAAAVFPPLCAYLLLLPQRQCQCLRTLIAWTVPTVRRGTSPVPKPPLIWASLLCFQICVPARGGARFVRRHLRRSDPERQTAGRVRFHENH